MTGSPMIDEQDLLHINRNLKYLTLPFSMILTDACTLSNTIRTLYFALIFFHNKGHCGIPQGKFIFCEKLSHTISTKNHNIKIHLHGILILHQSHLLHHLIESFICYSRKEEQKQADNVNICVLIDRYA